MELEFTKMHGLGNDFVLIEDIEDEIDLTTEAIAWLCDRNFGIGADGLLLVRPGVEGTDYQMLYFNADGSQAEMCGNGIRCFAKYIVDNNMLPKSADSLIVDTLLGPRPISFTRDPDGLMENATVDMGEPILEPKDIPTTLDGNQIFECPIETEYGTFEITALSMGNPHAIIWVEDVDEAPVDTVGQAIENNAVFPAKTNVEFAEYADGERIKLRVWERGVGETLACGTGACATLVAASLSCIVGRSATIELPGGELFIRWHEDGHVYMTGPARTVFDGIVHIAEAD